MCYRSVSVEFTFEEEKIDIEKLYNTLFAYIEKCDYMRMNLVFNYTRKGIDFMVTTHGRRPHERENF